MTVSQKVKQLETSY